MKVAIIGAGVSGLACAWQLEQLGVQPVIYERNAQVGACFNHVPALLQVFSRPLPDPMRYLHKQYGLEIKPLNTVERVEMHGPRITRIVSGRLGYLFTLGTRPDSVENQLLRQITAPVTHSTQADYRELARQYDAVVVADGTSQVARELGCWQDLIGPWALGANVLGRFDPHEIIMWLRREYCKAGYAYATPYDASRGVIALALPITQPEELQTLWQLFLDMEDIPRRFELLETFQIQHFAGFVYPHQVENIYLAGVEAGTVESFLGFGVLFSLISGCEAARSIVQKINYEQGLGFLTEVNQQLYEYRKMLDTLDNKSLDRLIHTLGAPVIRHLIYKTNTPLFPIGSRLLRLIERVRITGKPWH